MEAEKVKIAMLGPFPPSTGGIATSVQNILKSSLKKKYIFYPVSTMSRKGGTPEYANEKTYAKVCRVVGDIFHFIGFLLKISPPLIHINTSFNRWAFWRDSTYLLISKIFQKKVFFQIHGGELNEFCSFSFYLTKVLVKQILKAPELIAVLSSAQKKPFVEIALGKKVKVFPNPVELDKFRHRKNCRADFNIPNDYIVVLFIAANFYRNKGVMELLQAIPLVANKHEKVLFVFVGGGKEKDSMVQFCQKERIENYVTFTGHVTSDVIAHLLSSSDMLALPSYTEGFPLVILEAMASGLPIVATPVGAIPEVIEDGKNGFLVKPKDHIALANKIVWLIENKDARKKMGHRNIEKIQSKYDLNIVAEIFD